MTPYALTPKQEAFAREYAASGNGAAAARAAGYSPACAKQIAHETLQNPAVESRIDGLRTAFAATARRELAVLLADLEDALDWARASRDYRAMLEITRLKARLTGLIDTRAGERINTAAWLYQEDGSPGPLERAHLGWPAEGGEPADEDDPDFPLPGDAPPAHAGRSAALNRSESQANPRPPGSSRAADDASNAQCPASATRPPWFHDSARQDLNGFAAAVAKLEAELAA